MTVLVAILFIEAQFFVGFGIAWIVSEFRRA